MNCELTAISSFSRSYQSHQFVPKGDEAIPLSFFIIFFYYLTIVACNKSKQKREFYCLSLKKRRKKKNRNFLLIRTSSAHVSAPISIESISFLIEIFLSLLTATTTTIQQQLGSRHKIFLLFSTTFHSSCNTWTTDNNKKNRMQLKQ